ncbi:MAG: hypothetical protein EWV48_13345, partial [Microcystis aeruginosa Ma_QC_C_20070823_S13]
MPNCCNNGLDIGFLKERLKKWQLLGSSRLCVIIFAYVILKCLFGKTFRTILRIFYQYRPRFHT